MAVTAERNVSLPISCLQPPFCPYAVTPLVL